MAQIKSRNSRSYKRSRPIRPPYDRVLIVTEGSKTEINYFEEIRQTFRIPTAHVRVTPGRGTQPIQVVEYAIELFKGNPDFEKVFAVFDRDDFVSYHDAIMKAEATKLKLRNREKRQVLFEAVVSVPNFEVWFLMHFRNVTAWIHRDTVLRELCQHIPTYAKGLKGIYTMVSERFPTAKARAVQSRQHNTRLPGNAIYTDVDTLVDLLISLKLRS